MAPSMPVRVPASFCRIEAGKPVRLRLQICGQQPGGRQTSYAVAGRRGEAVGVGLVQSRQDVLAVLAFVPVPLCCVPVVCGQVYQAIVRPGPRTFSLSLLQCRQLPRIPPVLQRTGCSSSLQRHCFGLPELFVLKDHSCVSLSTAPITRKRVLQIDIGIILSSWALRWKLASRYQP